MASNTPPRSRSPRPARTGRGRPKDQDKRDAILVAAKALFSLQGLAGTSMEGIAQAAGVSKLTLYSHFRNKDELFRQTVVAKCGEYWPDGLFDLQARLPLRSRLRMIGRGFVDLVSSDEVMSLHRMMAAEGGRENKLGRLFWEAGPDRTMQRFAQVLEAASSSNEIDVENPRRAAAHFFSLLKGEFHLRTMVGAGPALSPEQRQAHVEDAVDVFLRAFVHR